MEPQFELDFGPEAAPTGKPSTIPDWNSLTDDDIADRYRKAIGINPKSRAFDRATMIAGIIDPQAESNRVKELDRIADEEDRRNTYPH